MEFKLWLEKQRRTSGKLGLYPPFYTQYMNYPPQEVLLWSSDAITYMDPRDIEFKAYDDGKFHPYFWKNTNM
jgi:hypothetical protein